MRVSFTAGRTIYSYCKSSVLSFLLNNRILIGEIISVEENFVLTLDRAKRFTHCSYCLIECAALIPCLKCTKVR